MGLLMRTEVLADEVQPRVEQDACLSCHNCMAHEHYIVASYDVSWHSVYTSEGSHS